jgi:plasmid stabilization system protein ParE
VKIVYTRRAESDLDGIAAYTDHVWGPRQCDIYLAVLRECCERVLPLKENWDEMRVSHADGRPRRSGLYGYRCRRHYVSFRQLSSRRLRIVRILHEKMLPERHL